MKEAKFDKAGVVIYGTNAQGKRAFVVPYSEGRFGHKHKYYALPIGTIDKEDANEYVAASRETEEETGIDMKKLLGEEAFDAFCQGKAVEGVFDSPGYPGVRIVHIGTQPTKHTYLSRVQSEKKCALFGIEVEGIEQLASHLKNQQNQGMSDHQVKHPVKQQIKESGQFPKFSELIEWLRSGEMPEAVWNKGQAAPASLYANYKEDENPFERLERAVMQGEKITTRRQLKSFCSKLTPEQDQEIGVYFEKIKYALMNMGIVSDTGTLKIDDKDTPLQFFQEGADIITAGEYIEQCSARIKDTPDYALAFGGKAAKDIQRQRRIVQSQLAAIAPFVPPMELLDAASNTLLSARAVKEDGRTTLHSDYTYWTSHAPYKPFENSKELKLFKERLPKEKPPEAFIR